MKPMKIFMLSVVCAVLLLSNFNCRKEYTKYKDINRELLDWFFADSTSYWVYRVNNQSEDSVTGRDNFRWYDLNKGRKRTKFLVGFYDFYFKSKNMGYISYMTTSDFIKLSSNYNNGGGFYAYSAVQMQQHFSKNRGPNYSMDTVIANYEANGIEFGNTIVYSVYPDGVQLTDTGVYYFTKGIGFTRIIDKGRKIDKQLVRYKYVRCKDIP